MWDNRPLSPLFDPGRTPWILDFLSLGLHQGGVERSEQKETCETFSLTTCEGASPDGCLPRKKQKAMVVLQDLSLALGVLREVMELQVLL